MGIRTIAGLLLITANLFLLPAHAIPSLEWESIGPYGDDQFEVRISPANPDTLFVIANAAVHRSTDAGLHWQPIHKTDMSWGGFYSLAFDPLDASHLFLASTAQGIWESRDEGDSWQNCSNGLPTMEGNGNVYYPIVSLAFDEKGSLFAGLAQSKGNDAPPAWVYRSDGGCSNWLPDDSGILITAPELTQNVATFLSIDRDKQLWAMVYGAGVYTYQNGAWLNRNGDLPSEGLRSTFLQHDPLNSNHILLGTEYNWIYETIDGGQSWRAMPLPEALVSLEVLPLIYAIGIDSNNNQIIYVRANDASGSIEQPIFHPQPHYQTAGGNTYLSLNGGIDWITVPYFFFRITFDPSETITSNIFPYGDVTRSRVLYLTSGGRSSLLKSEDGGMSFQVITDGIISLWVNNIWLHPSPPHHTTMLFAAAEAGLFFRPDDHETWTSQRPVQDYLYTWSFASDPQDPNAVFYSTGNPAWSFTSQRGIYRITLDCFKPGCPPGDQILSDIGVWQVITTPLQPETIYAACQEEGIMVSYDRGNNWSTFNDGLTLPKSITDIILDNDGIPLIAAARTNNGDKTSNPPQPWWPRPDEEGGVYRFDTETDQWLPTPAITYATLDLEVDPWNQQILFAATVRGLYKTADDGQTWELVVPDLIIHDLLTDPLRPNYLYAATSFGVFRSTDGGKQWHDLSTGLLAKIIYSLTLDPATGILYAGTAGNSVFQLIPEENPQPSIAIYPESLDSGVVPVGFNKDTPIIIINEGEADLIIDDIVPADPAFTLLDFSPPLTITPGSHSILTVRFSPQTLGIVENHITFHSNDPLSPIFDYVVRGEGREPIRPVPDVKVNGDDGPVTIPYGDIAQITIELSAGNYLGQEADFWLKLTSNDSKTYWFFGNIGWVESNSPLLATTSPIRDIDEPLRVNFGAFLSGPGEVYFAVDDNADGSFDGTWFDTVSFTVTEAPPFLFVLPE
ncbi:MAG: Ig-like domain-containing protein, partial [Planctomycetota bacterium]